MEKQKTEEVSDLAEIISQLATELRWLSGKESACQCRGDGLDPWVRKTPLEEEMATHSSILAREIP